LGAGEVLQMQPVAWPPQLGVLPLQVAQDGPQWLTVSQATQALLPVSQ